MSAPVMLAASAWFFAAQQRSLRHQAYTNLETTAQLKAGEIVQWRNERMGVARVVTESPLLAPVVARYLASATPDDAASLLTILTSLRASYHYDNVVLVDGNGEAVLSARPLGSPLDEPARQALATAFHDRRSVLTTLHVGPGDDEPRIETIAPLFTGSGDAASPLGAVVFQIDTRQFLFPLIQSWPTRSRTAETLLVRRDGDEVVYLNDLRHQTGTALSVRMPLSRTDVPSVKAVLGERGVVRGTDYRGVDVLAVLLPVADSPWILVAKIDEAEALSALRRESALMLALLVGLAAAAAAAVGVLWQRRTRDHFRAMFEAEAAQRKTEERADADHEQLTAQFIQAQKMESVGRLAGGVAHDFNNMLTVILGHAELTLGVVAPGQPPHASLLEIRSAARRSADLTSQLLTFARKQTVAPKVLDLNQAVEGTLNMLRRLIGEDVDLAWLPGSGLWRVTIDPSQIDQVLANLTVNARDAIAGTGKVTIETRNVAIDEAYCQARMEAVPGEYVILAVSDDGHGMDKEVLSHLFEPFFTTKPVGQGTGLGLATVYGIVKQNDGFINVYSEPGEGTTFRIYLPRSTEAPAEEPAEVAPEPPRAAGETVLVVEDEPAILTLSARMLERLGYVVLAASTSEEAGRLAAAHRGRIDLLLTDVVMPEMSGRDLAARLQALRPDLKVLFMSGYTANAIAHRGVLEEGVNFLQKPFSMRTLSAKVREALGEPGSRLTGG